MRLYLGYPDCVSPLEKFRLKDNFLSEVSVDYDSVPVEVKKKLLGILDNLDKKNYLFIGKVYYDGIDLLEFSLFGVSVKEYDELLLPGYLYGKPTYLIRSLIRNSFGRRISVIYDFNLFGKESLVINVGYTQTSISFGGELLYLIPIGEFHLIDFFGNYLFNRTISQIGISNSRLRKEGIRGEILDRCRAQGARILFGRSSLIGVPLLSFKREVPKKEVKLALSPLIGSTNYGELVLSPHDFLSYLVDGLYTYEELKKERLKVKEVVLIGRLTEPFLEAVERVIPVKARKVSEEELLEREVLNRNFKLLVKRFEGSNKVNRSSLWEVEEREGSIEKLRLLFNKKDLKGLGVIEWLTGNLKGKELERFVYELITIVRRSSFRSKEEVAYLNYSIAALTKVEVPEKLKGKVLKEIEKVAFNWQVPFETKMNVLYFCHKNREKVKGSSLELYPFLLLTYSREKNLTEGEKNFIRTVCDSFYRT
ncbi:hypothetical protein [Thermovibrio sp.]